MNFPDTLKNERKRIGLTQAEAAALLECGKRTLELWESGDRVPLPVTIDGVVARLKSAKPKSK